MADVKINARPLSLFVAMAFQSINAVLGALENQAAWRSYQELKAIEAVWTQTVGEAVSRQTHLLEVRQGVLKVATSNPVWAQQLTFERKRILTKLNATRSTPLRDIRFLPGYWHDRRSPQPDATQSWQAHPSSSIDEEVPPPPLDKIPPKTPQAAFSGWMQQVRSRSDRLPPCPLCGCPTPPGELDRWSSCAPCYSRSPGD